MSIGGILFIYFLATIVSCAYDVFSHDERMTKWERNHPGQTYQRGYRKMVREHPEAFA